MDVEKCFLASVINPGKYLVLSRNEHFPQIKHLEELLTKEINCLEWKKEEICLLPETNVAVKLLEDDKLFKRGCIKRRANKKNFYIVELIDYGKVVELEESKIFTCTNSTFNLMVPLSFTVTLHGLVPAEFCFVNEIKRQRVRSEWTIESKDFVEKLFETKKEILVKNILTYGNEVYGDIFIAQENGSNLSLRKMLVKYKFCIYSENYFLKNVFGMSDPIKGQTETGKCSEVTSKVDYDDAESKKKHLECFINNSSKINSNIKSDSGNCFCKNEFLFNSEKSNTLKPSGQGSKCEFRTSKCFSINRRPNKNESFKNEELENLRISGGVHKKNEPYEIYIGRGKKLIVPSDILFKQKQPGNRQLNSQARDSDNSSFTKMKTIENFIGKNEDVSDSNDSASKSGSCLEKVNCANRYDSSFCEKPVARENCKYSRNTFNLDSGNTKTFECAPDKSNKIDFSQSEKNLELSEILPTDNGKFRTNFPSEIPVAEKGEIKNSKENIGHKYLLRSVNYSEPIVLCKDSVLNPIDDFKDSPLESNVIKNLQKYGRTIRWTFPAIQSEQNVAVIGSVKTSEILSYAMPLVDFTQRALSKNLPEGNGPLVVIVCSSSSMGEFIYSICNNLVRSISNYSGSETKISIILAHGSGSEENFRVNLTNGCHILISTPHCLVRLLETPIVTNFDRLSWLVLNEIDIIGRDPFKYNVKIILEKARVGGKNGFCKKVFCGEKWTPEVERLVKLYFKSHTLIFTSYSEAAIFARLKPKVYLVDKNHKADVLMDKIKDDVGKKKILIACEDFADAIQIRNYLNGKGANSVVAREETKADDIKEIHWIWNTCKCPPIVVATDDVIGELKIKNADVLVHYSLTKRSKRRFFSRFSTIFDNCLAWDSDSKASQRNSKEGSSIVLVDDENYYQLPHLVNFFKRLGANVSTQLLEKCQEIEKKLVMSIKAPICENLLNMGSCRNRERCFGRHVFVDALDSPSREFSSDWISFSVVKVHDACTFSIKLVENGFGGNHENKSEIENLKELVRLKQNRQEFRKIRRLPEIGDICAVVRTCSVNEEVFCRAEIVEYLRLNKNNEPEEVKVRLVDDGDYMQSKITELYELPDELAKYPPVTIDVKLVGLQPLDFDVDWSEKAANFTRNLMTRKLEKDQCWLGKVVLSLRNLLFLEPIVLESFLPSIKTRVCDLVVGEMFLNNRLAVKNQGHLSNLKKLCVEGNIELPKEKINRCEKAVANRVLWAFFEKDFVRVNFSAAENASTVFVRVKKFENALADLEKDCREEAEKTKSEDKTSLLSVGMFCLAKFEERWNRGRVEKIHETDFFVYFVDYGDFGFVEKSNVIPINENLLLRLPCQAIECRLIGTGEEIGMGEKILDEIYNFSDEGKLDLYACVHDKNLKAEVTGGRKYAVNLLDLNGKSLNKRLVDEGLVTALESEKNYLEDVAIPQQQRQQKDDEEEEKESDEKKSDQFSSDEKQRETNEETSLGEYFSRMSNDLFENESELLFLKKFASAVFGFVPENVTKTPLESESLSRQEKATAVGAAAAASTLHPDGETMKKPELKIDGNFLTPRILWLQDRSEVRMKIVLSNVEKYRLDCTVTNFLFRCRLDGKFYAVDLKLFGSINPQLTEINLKTFHVFVRLKKLCYSIWPRLNGDEGKHRWINLDPDGFDADDNCFFELAERNVAKGMPGNGTRSNELFSFCDDSENGGDEDDDDDDDDDEL